MGGVREGAEGCGRGVGGVPEGVGGVREGWRNSYLGAGRTRQKTRMLPFSSHMVSCIYWWSVGRERRRMGRIFSIGRCRQHKI